MRPRIFIWGLDSRSIGSSVVDAFVENERWKNCRRTHCWPRRSCFIVSWHCYYRSLDVSCVSPKTPLHALNRLVLDIIRCAIQYHTYNIFWILQVCSFKFQGNFILHWEFRLRIGLEVFPVAQTGSKMRDKKQRNWGFGEGKSDVVFKVQKPRAGESCPGKKATFPPSKERTVLWAPDALLWK